MNRTLAIAALFCAGCGNYSTEDLRFLSALPRRADLRAEVPASGGTSGAATACTDGVAQAWLDAKPASDDWNSGVELIVGLVDVVRQYPPDWRKENERGWGPFPDEKHPGIEIQVYMVRDFPAALNGEPRYAYAFQARKKDGTDPFVDLIGGVFEGPSSSRGKGRVGLDFEAFWTLGMADPPDPTTGKKGTPHGTAIIAYDRTADPIRIFLTLYDATFANPQFQYAFKGWADGSGRFGFRLRDPATGNVFAVGASYDPLGAGRDVIVVTTPGGFTGVVSQCWDPAACLVYADDPGNWTNACAGAPCSIGVVSKCAAVREQPTDPWVDVQLTP